MNIMPILRGASIGACDSIANSAIAKSGRQKSSLRDCNLTVSTLRVSMSSRR
jgi:hypothetical protein